MGSISIYVTYIDEGFEDYQYVFYRLAQGPVQVKDNFEFKTKKATENNIFFKREWKFTDKEKKL